MTNNRFLCQVHEWKGWASFPGAVNWGSLWGKSWQADMFDADIQPPLRSGSVPTKELLSGNKAEQNSFNNKLKMVTLLYDTSTPLEFLFSK